MGCFFSDENNSTVLTDHSPAFSTENFTPQMIASPQAFFSASQPAKFVFDNGANFCGITRDLETRCWPQNWLDTGYTWRYFNLEKMLLLWDSTRVVALDNETFEVLFEAPNTGAEIWNGFPNTAVPLINAVISNAEIVDAQDMLLTSTVGIFHVSSNGFVDSVPGGSIVKGTKHYSGFWGNIDSVNCIFAYPDSLVCVNGIVGQSEPFTVGIGGSVAPTYWNGYYWWLSCESQCSVKRWDSEILPRKVYPMADVGAWGSYEYSALVSDTTLVFSYVDTHSEYYTTLNVLISHTAQHVDTSWTWSIERFAYNDEYRVHSWYNSKGNLVLALSDRVLVGFANPFRVTKSVKIYKLRSDGTLVK